MTLVNALTKLVSLAARDMHLLLLYRHVDAVLDFGNTRSHPDQDIKFKLGGRKNASDVPRQLPYQSS